MFSNIYSNHKKSIDYLIRSRIKKACDVEDLVQDIFVKIWEYRHNIDEDKPIKNLLYRITLNMVYNYNRHENVVNKYMNQLPNSLFKTSDSPDSILYFNELNSIIEQIIQELPKKQKEVFEMYWYKGQPPQKIADKKGLSLRTVDNQIYRARKKLQNELCKMKSKE